AQVEAKDREKDAISYIWNLGNGETKETSEPQIEYTFEEAGDYKVSVEVRDEQGEMAQSEVISVVAGNSRPEVAINLQGGNSSFFISGSPVKYSVTASDPDGGTIDASNIFVSVDYLESFDKQNMSLGHQQVSAAVTGKALTQGMDCKTCHKESEASIGPNYMDIAMKYKDKPEAAGYLQNKIISGGGGVWGEVVMPAHPTVTKDETRQMAEYIMSLADSSAKEKSLPASGTISPEPKQGDNVMVLTASYTDNGAAGTIPLTGIQSIILKKKGDQPESK
ncbi:MAG: PKD domain-containing protein, partial [Pricia sp.]